MKILITTGIYPPDVGGPALYTERVAREFVKSNHQVRVLTYSDNLGGETIKDGYRLFLVKRGSKLWAYTKYFFSVLRLAKDADVIYLQDSVSAGFPTTLANLFLRKRLVLKIVGDYAWEMGGNKITSVLDGFYPFDADKYSSKIEILQKVQTWVAKNADKIITPSEYLKKIVNSGWGIEREKINVVYNSAKEISNCHPASNFPEGGGTQNSEFRNPNLIVSVGRLVPWKGFDTLIDLMPELLRENSDFRLEIIGDGPEEENLKRLVKDKNLEGRVFFSGRLPHQEVIKKLKIAGVFVLNTRYEGLSHVLIEALTCGVPVVTTNVGGNPEVIDNYENGYLVDYDDRLALKSTILKIGGSKELREGFRKKGFESLEKFNFNKMIKNTLEVFNFKDESLREVLMISTDKTILDPTSVSAERMRDYGSLCERLHIIVFNADEVKERARLADNICVHPTNSFVKPWAILGAISIGKRILQNRKVSAITAQNPFETGLVGHYLSWRFKVGLNIQLHGDFFGNQNWYKESFLNKFRSIVGRRIIKRADAVRVVSKRVKNSLMKELDIREDKIVVVPIFTDTERIRRTPGKFDLQSKFSNNYPLLLAVGRLEREKNYPFLFNVLKRVVEELPRALLFIVGSGSLRGELEERARQMNLEKNIIFEGWQDDLISYYKSVDMYLMTSDYEGWGRTVVESRAAGCPVVMKDVGVAGEMVVSGEDGFVRNDEEGFARIIVELSKNLLLRQRVVCTAEKRLSKLYSKESVLNLIKNSWNLARK